MRKKLKIGVFGGYRGGTMIKVLLDHDDAELVAVCDKYPEILEGVKKQADEVGMSVACYENFDDFIEHDMDAVVLANYATEHAPFAIRCLERGMHVLSEVLPAETPAQAVALIEAVEKSGKVYAYAENYCYMDHTFEMWRRYQNGDIGEVMYAEGEYIHDCSLIWPSITYGDRHHWRNRTSPTFYCTHSLGPMMTITGRRPVRVVGFETAPAKWFKNLGAYKGTGVEMVVMDNGAVFKSIHGDLKRQPDSINYIVYGQKGMMETGRLSPLKKLNVYQEAEDHLCGGPWDQYDPEQTIASEKAKKIVSHGGSDFYATHFFIEKILGNEEGKWSIDVYQAVDMGMCGLLAYRSVLDGNKPYDVPDFRDPAQRDAWRNDNACTTPEVAGDQLLPRSSWGEPEIPDKVYDKVREYWLAGKEADKKDFESLSEE